MPSKRPPLIALAPHPWWNHWLSRQQLLSRLGERGWPILYSFGPLSVWERHTRHWGECPWLGRVVSRDHVLVDYPGRFPATWPKFPAWDAWYSRHYALKLKKTVARQGGGDQLIALLFHPSFQPWLAWLKPRHVAYHVYDAYHMMDNWDQEMAIMEQSLIQRSELITTSSAGMAANLPGSGPKKARVLNNGADSARFLRGVGAPCPQDMAAIPHPRIGYVGSINAKMDMDMILTVSEHQPDWHWVFLGQTYMNGEIPAVRSARDKWGRLLERNNVHFLGRKTAEEMPAYVNNMDVLTICYKIARVDQGESASWVVHGYPTKLHEFLATGRPVVAGSQQVIVDHFSHVVRLADDAAGWEAAIEEALTTGGVGDVASRQKVAMENTWESRVDQLERWLEMMVAG
ncbi:MAG: glycosyltransferase [Magnetococcales bacterium]|nr:glycosyltransferase [Magnetococcales bacterium]